MIDAYPLRLTLNPIIYFIPDHCHAARRGVSHLNRLKSHTDSKFTSTIHTQASYTTFSVSAPPPPSKATKIMCKIYRYGLSLAESTIKTSFLRNLGYYSDLRSL